MLVRFTLIEVGAKNCCGISAHFGILFRSLLVFQMRLEAWGMESVLESRNVWPRGEGDSAVDAHEMRGFGGILGEL